ncbi:Hypothetical predicted protein [Paramuricea clavata]|uniref:Uncharacterized protein n=1 Tax=Paramuricea clavata TaxID=317549 RepID=A0A7D9HR89_PARCT|nr:Hypothetical predicted protein [Paramuricea clavata]
MPFGNEVDFLVHQPCETISDDEPLIMIKMIKDDYSFYNYFLNFSRNHASAGHNWPVVWTGDRFMSMPSFYIYLIDGTLYDDGERVITIGVIHWLMRIYAEIQITFSIYAIHYDTDTYVFLPGVTFEQWGYKFEYVELGGLTTTDTILFVSKTVDKVLEYISLKVKENPEYQVYDIPQIEKDIQQYCVVNGVQLSRRLFQVLINNQFLVNTVYDFIKEQYCQDSGCKKLCYCGSITDGVLTDLTLQFEDRGNLVGNVLF